MCVMRLTHIIMFCEHISAYQHHISDDGVRCTWWRISGAYRLYITRIYHTRISCIYLSILGGAYQNISEHIRPVRSVGAYQCISVTYQALSMGGGISRTYQSYIMHISALVSVSCISWAYQTISDVYHVCISQLKDGCISCSKTVAYRVISCCIMWRVICRVIW